MNGSLGYATRVKNIKNNAVVGSDSRETARLKAQIESLEEQLAEFKSDKGMGAAASSDRNGKGKDGE